ncbi:MAG: type II secretion system F family protein [Arcobacteraceae bacterium]
MSFTVRFDMKFKVTYQENRQISTKVFMANTLKELYTQKDFPNNIIKIREIKEFDFGEIFAINSKKNVYELFSQLSIMLSANLTFSESIDLLLETKQEKKIEEILQVIKQSLSSSVPIDQALHKYTKYLGKTSILFLKLGFENSNIKDAMSSLVEILDEDMKSSEKLSEVMRYPIILFVSLFISIGMIFIYVLPNFEFVFSLLKDDVPLSTQVLLTLKDIVNNYWIFIIVGIALSGIAAFLLIQKYRYVFDSIILLHIPIFSKMIQDYYFYRLFLSLSIIVRSKYQFQTAIVNSKNIVNNLYVQEKIDDILLHIKNGMSISEAFVKTKIFDSLTIKLLHTADNTNKYESILQDITTQYKKRFHKSLQNFSSTIEPLLILVISLIVLWLILAIMLPIWDLGSVIN